MSRAKASILSGLLAATILMSGCNSMTDSKVATVDGTPITKSAYDKTYSEFEKAFHLESMPEAQKSMMSNTLKQMTLNKLVFQTLVYNEAAKANIQVTEQDIKDYKEKKIFKDPNLKNQFQGFLDQNHMKESDFDAMLKDNLLMNKLIEAKGGAEVQVTDAEVKSFYDKNQDQFKLPERIHATHILIKAIVPQMKQELLQKNPKMTPAEVDQTVAKEQADLKAKADKIYAEVKADPSKFAALATADSEDPMSAKSGGDLGLMAQGTTDPAFWNAIAKTANGQLYPGVVTSQFGYHIVKVLDRQPPHLQTFAEAKEMIREHMAQMKKQLFMQKWAEQQKTAAKINIEPAYKPTDADAAAPGGAAMTAPGGSAAGPAPAAPEHASPEMTAPAAKK